MNLFKLVSVLSLSFLISFSSIADEPTNLETPEINESVESELANQTDLSRENLIDDAVEALTHTREALAALDEGRVDEALESLALSIGKMELVIACHPELALAPTGISITTHDIYGTKAAVANSIKEAERQLKDGNVQAARHILSGMGSEVVISTTNLPLATYPAAIKAISPLIDAGDIGQAKARIQAALNTLVITNEVVPLPIIRAKAMLTLFAAYADQSELTPEQAEALEKALDATREQVELAEMLGYGEKDFFKPIYKELNRMDKDEYNSAAFNKLQDLLGSYQQS